MLETIDVKADEKGGNGRLMSIREVSALTGVPPHTLRFWEKQMPDVLRPKRTPGGQRRYSPEMTERVRMIKRLSDEKKYSLAAIREHLGAVQHHTEHRPDIGERTSAERAVELIIDEMAELLKERLLDILEAGKTGKAENPGPTRAELAPPEL